MITILIIIYFAYNVWATNLILEFIDVEGIQNIVIKHILFYLTCLPAIAIVIIIFVICMIYESVKFDDELLYKIINYKPFKRK